MNAIFGATFILKPRGTTNLHVIADRATLVHMTCAADLRFHGADNIHSDRCRVPLVPLLWLSVAPATRSLRTATHSGGSDEHDLKCPVGGGAAA